MNQEKMLFVEMDKFSKKVQRIITHNTYATFNLAGYPIVAFKCENAYKEIDALIKKIIEEAGKEECE